MSSPITRVLTSVGRNVRDVLSSVGGAVLPPLRSKDGTFGTQHAQARDLDAQRRAKYPRD